MEVVIPMAGFGERFRRAGHQVPKPLLVVDGAPMIHHVLDLFPGVDDPLLLCNAEHLAHPEWRLREVLLAKRPKARIVAVAPHRLGPVHTLVHCLEHLDLADEVVVSVCDLDFPWDFNHFRGWVRQAEADGCVVCYRGFHPHLLHSVHYAFCQATDRWVTSIREKHAYTDDPIGNLEWCSNGVYYWRTGHGLLEALQAVYDDPTLAIAGEHYPSQCFEPMVRQGQAVAVYEVQHYLQWGNPRDLREYEHHARGFAARMKARTALGPLPGTLLVPMAGLGQRFADAGYRTPKPLIEVSGRPMAVAAVLDLPRMARQVFVLRRDMPGAEALAAALKGDLPEGRVVWLEGPTDGQARTVALGLAREDVDPDAPLVIGTCDNGLTFDDAAHARQLEQADVLVWGVRGHPGASQRPHHFGWIEVDGDRVVGLSVKRPLADPAHDPIVIGTFSFARARDYSRAMDRLEARDGRVNGELYVDSLIEDCLALGLDVRLFEVGHYHGWGTPNELRTWQYWQACLHGRPGHPYTVRGDPTVAPEAVERLAASFALQVPSPLAPRHVDAADDEPTA